MSSLWRLYFILILSSYFCCWNLSWRKIYIYHRTISMYLVVSSPTNIQIGNIFCYSFHLWFYVSLCLFQWLSEPMAQIILFLFLPGRCTDLTWIKDVTVCYTPLWNVILSILISQMDFCTMEIIWDIKIDKITFQRGV